MGGIGKSVMHQKYHISSCPLQDKFPVVDEDLKPSLSDMFRDLEERNTSAKKGLCMHAKELSVDALNAISGNFSSLLRASANAKLKNKLAAREALPESEHRLTWDRLLMDFFKNKKYSNFTFTAYVFLFFVTNHMLTIIYAV